MAALFALFPSSFASLLFIPNTVLLMSKWPRVTKQSSSYSSSDSEFVTHKHPNHTERSYTAPASCSMKKQKVSASPWPRDTSFCHIRVFPSFTLTSFIYFLNEKMSPVPPVYLGSLINAPLQAAGAGNTNRSLVELRTFSLISFHSRNALIPSGMQNHPSLSVDWPSQRVLNPFIGA